MDLQRIALWLKSWPLWKAEMPLFVEFTDAAMPCAGLFPTGVEEVAVKTDVLGNRKVSCRDGFTLRVILPYPDIRGENARWLLALQQWVQCCDGDRTAPTFGDVPGAAHIRAEKGRIAQLRQKDRAMYTVFFTAEYIKNYEVME